MEIISVCFLFFGDPFSLYENDIGDQQMAAPHRRMPDMAKMMKIMIMFRHNDVVFFNSYGAGLSLYNFISN
jgi:membrane protein insertase Oxa1/YidC/SpoIIIJ